MAGQLDGFFNSMIVNVYYTYLLLNKLREINDLRQQLDATDRMRSLEKNRVHVLQWIQNLGPFQQVEEEEEEDEGFISIYLLTRGGLCSWSALAIHNQPPCKRFLHLKKFNLTWDLSVRHAPFPKLWKGLRAAGLWRKFWKNLIHASTQGRGTPPRTPSFISYRRFTRQLIVGIVGLEWFLPITQRVLTLLTSQFFAGSCIFLYRHSLN